MKKNPDMVIVDTNVIANAPVRLLVAGMGDAFATYYEARACHQSGTTNYTGGRHTEAAFALAKLCNDILLEYGVEAKQSVEKKEWSEALEKVVEANILLSGVGFENNGCAIAHAIYNGMTAAIKPFPIMHGEGVAFGTIVQLVTEYMVNNQWNDEEFKEVLNFYVSVGLPYSFENLGIDSPSDQLLMEISEATCSSGPNAHKMPFEVTPQVIYESLLRVNKLYGLN
jgi:glycerol dehydrogenase